jgi:SRF-type transcription factor (DNA-binding and dimerisation domain)
MGKKGKSSEGRKKVEMKKIVSEDARQVCFSKRKKGVFTKAAELSTMCGAEVALLLYSPKGTPYTFGSHSVDKVFNQFMSGEQNPTPDQDPNVINAINQLNQEYMELTERLNAGDARREALEERIKYAASQAKECEWVDKIDQLGRDELLQLLGSLYRAKCAVNERMLAIAGQGGAGLSNMDASTSMPSNAGMASGTRLDLSIAPPAPEAPDGTSSL